MPLDDAKLKDILVRGSYISADEMRAAEEAAASRRSSPIAYLLTKGVINKDILGQAIAESLNVPYYDLNTNIPTEVQVREVPEETAKRLRIVLVQKEGDVRGFATDDPTRANLPAELAKLFPGKKISIAYSLSEDIDVLFSSYRKTLETRFSKIVEQGKRVAPEMLDAIFADALDLHVSDIHLEPEKEGVLVRFRVDGVLRDAGRMSKSLYENVLNRIKVQSGIRLDEHFAAQDGAMQFVHEDKSVDVRTSIVPTVEGEKVVLRVLSSYVQGLSLSELGLTAEHQAIVEEAAEKPFGMILIAGPTGSGKTTTLYGVLKLLNQSDVNITTIEDPVEYKMHGVNQIQVNPVTNLTFAKGLRSIARQDPDVILVGEIRDQETAEIAVNAALTGHLLLSTFHANDAATAIPRLLDMGAEPFLLASTLELAVAQRLVRKICDRCRHSVERKKKDILAAHKNMDSFFADDTYTLYEGKGCEACGGTGYRGRTALFEIIRMTPEMESLILKHPSTQEIWKLAREQGAHTLFEDGILKVKNGITTLDELLRVAEPPAPMAA